MVNWYYGRDGQQVGPVDDSGRLALAQAGVVHSASLVWHEGMADWVPLGSSDFIHSAAVGPPPVAARAGASAFSTLASDFPDEAEPELGLFAYYKRAMTQRYVDFNGRARRREYWGYVLFFWLFLILAVLAGYVLDVMVGNVDPDDVAAPDAAPLLTVLFGSVAVFGSVLPGLAVAVRRFHDQNLTGWLYLLALIPYAGGLILLVFMLLPGTAGSNRFGPPTK